jgi:membrane protease YdiL (CAAX protease family)
MVGERENPPWNLWDVLRLALVTIASLGVFSILAMSLAGGGAGREAAAELAHDPRVVVPAQLAAYLIVIAFMAQMVRLRAGSFWEGIRWNWPATAWPGYLVAGMALAIAVQLASMLLPFPKSLPIEHYFRERVGAWLMALFGISLAPLMEELFFRGFLYPALGRKLGSPLSIALTAAAFASIHAAQLAWAPAPLLIMLAVGLALTLVRARSRSVGATFLMHVGYNATLFALLYIGTEGFRNLEKMA